MVEHCEKFCNSEAPDAGSDEQIVFAEVNLAAVGAEVNLVADGFLLFLLSLDLIKGNRGTMDIGAPWTTYDISTKFQLKIVLARFMNGKRCHTTATLLTDTSCKNFAVGEQFYILI